MGDIQHQDDEKKQQQCMQLLMDIINKDLVEIGLSRPIEARDYEDLDPQTFVKILVYLLTSSGVYTADQLCNKSEIMLKFEGTGLPHLEYEATMDYIYWAVKRIFPDDDQTFTYGLLLNPKSNPRMVKNVLIYLMNFNLFTNDCAEVFENISEEVKEEQTKRAQLHKKIDDANSKIQRKTEEIEERKNVVPSLEEKLREINDELKTEEDAIAELEQEVLHYKKLYETDELEEQRLQRNLEELNQQRIRLEAQLVLNPQEIQNSLKEEGAKVERLIHEREALGQQLDKLCVEDTMLDELIKKGEVLWAHMERTMDSLSEIQSIAEEQKILDTQARSLEAEFRSVIANLKLINVTRDNARMEQEEDLHEWENKVQTAMNQLHNFQGKIAQLDTEKGKKLERKSNMKNSIKSLKSDERKLQETVQADNEWLTITFPAEFQEWIRQLEEEVNELKEQATLAANIDGDSNNRSA